MKSILTLIALALPFAAHAVLNPTNAWYHLKLSAELGYTSILSHTIQLGTNGTTFDYQKNGGQDNLLPFNRYTVDLSLFGDHVFTFLYQPIEIRTEKVLSSNLVVNTNVFTAGTPMDFRYSFSFFRVSYLWNFLRSPNFEMGAGLSLQLRNASIGFGNKAGTQFWNNQDVGPVPILKFRTRVNIDEGPWFALDADGFYASSAFFNGAEFNFTGAIWDVSLQAGLGMLSETEAFVSVRVIGGGAEGTEKYPEPYSDGYTRNWLNTVSLSLGFSIE